MNVQRNTNSTRNQIQSLHFQVESSESQSYHKKVILKDSGERKWDDSLSQKYAGSSMWILHLERNSIDIFLLVYIEYVVP